MRSTKFQGQYLGRSASLMVERCRTKLWPLGWGKKKITKRLNVPIIDGRIAMLLRPQADMTRLWKENLSENPIGPTSPAMKTTDGSGRSALPDAHVVEGTETIACTNQSRRPANRRNQYGLLFA